MKKLNALVDRWLAEPADTLVELNAIHPDTFVPDLEELTGRLAGRDVNIHRNVVTPYNSLNPFFPFDEIVGELLESSRKQHARAPFVYFVARGKLASFLTRSTASDFDAALGAHRKVMFMNSIIELFAETPGRHLFIVERYDLLSATAAEVFENLLKHGSGRIAVIAVTHQALAPRGAAPYTFRKVARKGRSGVRQLLDQITGLEPQAAALLDIIAVVRVADPRLIMYFLAKTGPPRTAARVQSLLVLLARQGYITPIGRAFRLSSNRLAVQLYNRIGTGQRVKYHRLAGRYYRAFLPHKKHLQAVHSLFGEQTREAFDMFIGLARTGIRTGTGQDALRELNLAVATLATIVRPDPAIRRARVELYYLITLVCFQQKAEENARRYFEQFERYSKQERNYLRDGLLAIRSLYIASSPAERIECSRERLAWMKRQKTRDYPTLGRLSAGLVGLYVRSGRAAEAQRCYRDGMKLLDSRELRKYALPLLIARYEDLNHSAMDGEIAAFIADLPEPADPMLKAEYHILRSFAAFAAAEYDAMLIHQDRALHAMLGLGNHMRLVSMLERFTNMNIACRQYNHVQQQVEGLVNRSALFLEELAGMGVISRLARTINRSTGEQRRTGEMVKQEIAFLEKFDRPRQLKAAYAVLGDIHGEGFQPRENYWRALAYYGKAYGLAVRHPEIADVWDRLDYADVLVKIGRPVPARRVMRELHELHLQRRAEDAAMTRIDIARIEAMILAAERQTVRARKRFEQAVRTARSDTFTGRDPARFDAAGRLLFEYAVFLYEHREHPRVKIPVSRILEIFDVVRDIFQKTGTFFVLLKSTLEMVDRINRENFYEVALQEKQETLFRLMESLSAINAIHDMNELLPRITDLALATLRGERGVIYLDTEGTLYPVVIRGMEPGEAARASAYQAAAQYVFKNRKPLLTTSRDIYEAIGAPSRELVLELRSVMVVPIMSGRGQYGAIFLDSAYFSRAFNPDAVELLTAFANQAAISLENVRLYEAATRDGLTGLYGHVAFREMAHQEVRSAERYGHTATAVILDIDHFKDVNDTYGHAVGNQLLIEFARLITDSLRSSDLISRYGGDEFEFLLPRSPKGEAHRLFERIRSRVEAHTFLRGAGDIRVTISVGLAAFPEDTTDWEELFKRADSNLYASKRAGRNRVTVQA